MASSWSGLQTQVQKVKSAVTKLTPPEPDDGFEDERREVIKRLDKLDTFLVERQGGELEDDV